MSLSGREVSVALPGDEDEEEDVAEAMDSRLSSRSLPAGVSGGVCRADVKAALNGVVGGESRSSPGVKGGVRTDMVTKRTEQSTVGHDIVDLDKIPTARGAAGGEVLG